MAKRMIIKKHASADPHYFFAYAAKWHEEGPTAQKRFYLLRYWDIYGIEKTIAKYNVSKSTLYRWRSRLTENGLAGLGELHSMPTIPKHKRQPVEWPQEVINEIIMLKMFYPGIGRQRLHYLLKHFCTPRQLPCPCPSSISRLLKNRAPGPRKIPAAGMFISPSILVSYYRGGGVKT